MFVFTVSCDVSQDVYVGSAKESIEAQWASIVAAADEGQEGALQAAIRLHGVEKFSVEEWAFAENSRELRELLSEAKETLGARPIKLGRASDGVNKRSGATQVSSDIRELFSMAKAEYESELVEELIPAEGLERNTKTTGSGDKTASSSSQGTRKPSAAEKEELLASEKVANGRSGSASKEKRIKEAITAEREQRSVLRQQQASAEAKEMQAVLLQIEQRRLAQKKKPAASKRGKSKTSLRSAVSSKPPKSSAAVSSSKAAVKSPAKVAVAKGRTGSSLKEKRIKEAIEQEKASIEAAKRQQAESQADEMAAILNRLDERNKAAATYKRKL
ncbi:hypothetical protein [uncultured Pseudoteredinibacter sp.]|uniref:hypothetical protein n=1 Tax=uncultured Pseudoteredinibacter sp. TaxID=1641701 RepID=UPI00261601A3|nr:hypothetical protein [uncultured Pseudoteredinibacter sp.]